MFYESKVVPYLKQTKSWNLLTGIPFIGTDFELRELGRVLYAEEDIGFLSECKFNGFDQILAVVTTHRLILIQKGLVINRNVYSWSLDQILGVNSQRKLAKGQVTITADGGASVFSLTDLWVSDTERFANTLHQAKFNYEKRKRGML